MAVVLIDDGGVGLEEAFLFALGRSLSVKLSVILVVVLGIGFATSSWLTVRKHTAALMSQILVSADRVADVLQSATRQGMMRNRRGDVREIIQTVGAEPGVDRIRIYNKAGEIIVSTDTTELFKRVNAQAEACVVCHTKAGALTIPLPNLRYRVITMPDGHRSLGLISPIRNSPPCSGADCHAHPADRAILGVFDVRMSLAGVDEALARSRRDLITWSVVLAVLAASASGFFVWRFVHCPINRLARGTRELAAGNLDYRIPIDHKDELGQLARDFNHMTGELATARAELTEWTRTLESRVTEKTRQLQRINEGMAQIDKLASLGRLAATVAHELNNPISGINTYVSLGMRRLGKSNSADPAIAETIKELRFIHDELDRCGKIVKNLLLFSRSTPVEHALVPMEEVVSHCTQLVSHHLKLHDIQPRIDLEPSLIVYGDAQQLRQALVAILINAVEAMPNGGELTISGKRVGSPGVCELVVTDTGRGIAEGDLPHVFEPFFSSKTDCAGVGLGLSVVYGIMQQHDGRIVIDSKVGEGTKVTMVLPTEPGRAVPGDDAAQAAAGGGSWTTKTTPS
jgi:two-component system NtrC family sensor kinase